MAKPRYCPTCGYSRIHRQVVSGGILVQQCTFCHADKPQTEPKIQVIIIRGKDIWDKAPYN